MTIVEVDANERQESVLRFIVLPMSRTVRFPCFAKNFERSKNLRFSRLTCRKTGPHGALFHYYSKTGTNSTRLPLLNVHHLVLARRDASDRNSSSHSISPMCSPLRINGSRIITRNIPSRTISFSSVCSQRRNERERIICARSVTRFQILQSGLLT